MSTAASITVKKNDGTTDVIYGLLNGRSGDNPARWQAPALGATAATKPELRVMQKTVGGQPDKAKLIGTFMYPYSVVNTTTGVTSVVNREMGKFEYTGDTTIPQAARDEAASQFCNLVYAAFKEWCKELGAPV